MGPEFLILAVLAVVGVAASRSLLPGALAAAGTLSAPSDAELAAAAQARERQAAALAAAKAATQVGAFTQVASQIPVVGAVVAPMMAIGNAVAGLFGISPSYQWDRNFNPYTDEGPFHSFLDSLWNSPLQIAPGTTGENPVTGLTPQPGESVKHFAIRNVLTSWKLDGSGLTPMQQQWLDLNGASVATTPSQVSSLADAVFRIAAPQIVTAAPLSPPTTALPAKPSDADLAQRYGITVEQVGVFRTQGTSSTLIAPIIRSKFPLIFA